jgi:branched-chain amino acid transport system permease protein
LAVLLAPRIGFAGAFIASPILVAAIGVAVERVPVPPVYRSDPILSLLLTFGLAMVIEQSLRMLFGAAPLPFSIPDGAQGPGLRRRVHLPALSPDDPRRCAGRGRGDLGRRLPDLLSAASSGPAYRIRDGRRLGISLAPYMTAIVALGIGLAGLAGVLLAPISGVHPPWVRRS